MFASAICVYRSEGVNEKGEGTASIFIPVVKVTELNESFGIVESCLDSHPVDPSTILGVHGQPHYQGRNLSFYRSFS